jgi:hypothetical protein
VKRSALLLLLLLAAACGDGAPIPDENLLLRIDAEVDEVVFGQGFALRVVRVWSKDLEPVEWEDDALAPLTVRLLETRRRENEGRVEETRLYRAHAFTLGAFAVTLPTLRAVPKAGGAERVVSGNRLALRVRRNLDPADPGPPELPGGPLTEPRAWRLWTVGALLAVAALAVLLFQRRRRALAAVTAPSAAPAEPSVPQPGPAERALERIERLRALSPRSPEEVLAFHRAAAALTRDYLTERFGLSVTPMTTEECLESVESLPADVLAPCDLVKFARHPSSERERAGVLDAAERFVRRSAEGGTP